MSQYVLEPEFIEHEQETEGRRQDHGIDEHLILSELDANAVIDHLDSENDPIELITFGNVRETCPKCPRTHLKLVLRQRRVRVAHLFCAQCHSCFDAHYANGVSALTI